MFNITLEQNFPGIHPWCPHTYGFVSPFLHTHTHTHHQRKEKQHQTCIPSGAAALCPRGTGLGRAAALKATKSVCAQHDAHSCAGCYSSMSCSYLAITTSASAFR